MIKRRRVDRTSRIRLDEDDDDQKKAHKRWHSALERAKVAEKAGDAKYWLVLTQHYDKSHFDRFDSSFRNDAFRTETHLNGSFRLLLRFFPARLFVEPIAADTWTSVRNNGRRGRAVITIVIIARVTIR